MADIMGTAKLIIGRVVPEIADNLITDRADVVLAASQGVALNDKIIDVSNAVKNTGDIFTTGISGTMGLTDLVFTGGSLNVPAGTYIIMINLGTISANTISQITIKSEGTGIAFSTSSSSLLTFASFSATTKLTAYGRMVSSVSVTADARFNYFKAIRIA